MSEDSDRLLSDLMRVPFVELAARVARFASPFEYFAAVKATFGPIERFILNAALAGEESALVEREIRIRAMLPPAIGGEISAGLLDRSARYLSAHKDALLAFRRQHYAWLSMAAAVPEPVPSLDLLDEVISSTMAEYAFDLNKRKKKRSEWRCTSRILQLPIELYFEQGNWKMHAYLRVSDLPYFDDVGQPFLFSQIEFRYGDHFEEQVRSFFAEYGKFFPHVIETIERALPIRKKFISGDKEGAIEMAREMAPKPTLPLA